MIYKNNVNMCSFYMFVSTAAQLQSSLNLEVDPCDNFYEYACGRWIRNNPIAPDRSRWSQFDFTRKVLLDKLRGIYTRHSCASQVNTYPFINDFVIHISSTFRGESQLELPPDCD